MAYKTIKFLSIYQMILGGLGVIISIMAAVLLFRQSYWFILIGGVFLLLSVAIIFIGKWLYQFKRRGYVLSLINFILQIPYIKIKFILYKFIYILFWVVGVSWSDLPSSSASLNVFTEFKILTINFYVGSVPAGAIADSFIGVNLVALVLLILLIKSWRSCRSK